MKKAVLYIVLLLIILIGGFLGYSYLTQPELGEVPPIPAESSSLETGTTDGVTTEMASTGATPVDTDTAVDENANPVLVIEVAGSTSGVIEIELLKDVAPAHAERIMALAAAGTYDNVVFHRVIDGFMAQTGDVEFGKRGGEGMDYVGMGGSDMPDLPAEFSGQKFVKGAVGMARSQDPNSANSQFFIMFDEAPYLNGQYTIVGRVIAGQDVVSAIKKGDTAQNGTVSEPDYMKAVRIKGDNG